MTFDFNLIFPEIFLVIMICVILLVDLFAKQRQHIFTYSLTQLSLVAGFVFTFFLHNKGSAVDFHGLFINDQLATILKLSVYATSVWVFLYARDYIRQFNIPQGEFYILGLFSILGMLVSISAHHFLSLYLGIELMSLPIYAMVALYRDHSISSEAAIKYFVLGAIASGMLLYGLSMLYGATHSLDIGVVAQSIRGLDPSHLLILILGLVFIVVGIAFKIGTVPFHMWIPDVYQGAPTAVTLFIAVAPKLAAFAMAIRLLVEAMPSLTSQWQQLVIVMAVLSMLLGNIVAILQTSIKRMFAYSSIAHSGYMLLGFCAATPAGFSAALFYAMTYAIMSLGGFGLLTLLSKKGVEVDNMDALRGLNARNPWLALMMLLLLFSMAGIPPTIGFFAKLSVLEALITAHLVWLACVALMVAVVGSYYYLRVVKVMYFDQPLTDSHLNISWDVYLGISVNGLVILILGLFPSLLISLCQMVFLR